MKRWFILSALLLFFSQAYSISNEEIRAIMDKNTASVGDALAMVGDMDGKEVNIKGNNRLSALKKDANLDAGLLGVIFIEMKKAKGGLFYAITGFGKYAAESLIYNGIYPAGFSWNRPISGNELIEFVSAIKDKASVK